jgi:hypothetical protein
MGYVDSPGALFDGSNNLVVTYYAPDTQGCAIDFGTGSLYSGFTRSNLDTGGEPVSQDHDTGSQLYGQHQLQHQDRLRAISTSLARQNQLAMRPIPNSRNVDGSGLTVGRKYPWGKSKGSRPLRSNARSGSGVSGNVGMPCSRLLVCPSAYRWMARIPIFRLSKSVTNTEQKTLPMFLSSQGEWIIWSGINSHDRLKPSSYWRSAPSENLASRTRRDSCFRHRASTGRSWRGSRAGVKRKARANSFIRENCNTV